eukprot:257654-Pyramimonas_sp.AAC.1
MLPNGDWSDRDRIIVRVPRAPRDQAEDDSWRERVVTGLAFAARPNAFNKFARNRWFGKEAAVD